MSTLFVSLRMYVCVCKLSMLNSVVKHELADKLLFDIELGRMGLLVTEYNHHLRSSYPASVHQVFVDNIVTL